MRFEIVGANAESGDDVDVFVDAPTSEEVEKIAHDRGILVSAIKPAITDGHAVGTGHAAAANGATHGATNGAAAPPSMPAAAPAKTGEMETIALIEDEPGSNGAPHGMITVSANSPSDTAHTGAGHIEEGKKSDAAMEYHVIMNQSLYLLETAVNRHIKEGWEPQGGLTVGMSNNAMQYFQSIIRRKKAAT